MRKLRPRGVGALAQGCTAKCGPGLQTGSFSFSVPPRRVSATVRGISQATLLPALYIPGGCRQSVLMGPGSSRKWKDEMRMRSWVNDEGMFQAMQLDRKKARFHADKRLGAQGIQKTLRDRGNQTVERLLPCSPTPPSGHHRSSQA